MMQGFSHAVYALSFATLIYTPRSACHVTFHSLINVPVPLERVVTQHTLLIRQSSLFEMWTLVAMQHELSFSYIPHMVDVTL